MAPRLQCTQLASPGMRMHRGCTLRTHPLALLLLRLARLQVLTAHWRWVCTPFCLLDGAGRYPQGHACRASCCRRVHEHNVDSLMTAALPYHETEQFVRLVQVRSGRACSVWRSS